MPTDINTDMTTPSGSQPVTPVPPPPEERLSLGMWIGLLVAGIAIVVVVVVGLMARSVHGVPRIRAPR